MYTRRGSGQRDGVKGSMGGGRRVENEGPGGRGKDVGFSSCCSVH